VLKQALLRAQGPLLLPEFLPEAIRTGAASVRSAESPVADDGATSLEGSPVLGPSASPDHERGTGGELTSPEALDWGAFLEDRLRAGSQDLYAEAMALIERSLVTRVLRHTQGNQAQAAKVLGITRGSLRTKIRTLGITIERSVWSVNNEGGS
jgi:two-component system nitrogen regulation response regulator GlnG